ncbi:MULTISPECIES: LPS translocon maturation chaperone LptM [Halomonadaceae]|uniref:Lipopeptide n=1 Tax=Vreelandella halophila TaxID=86177 RepID=A0A9X4YBS1_9GAMM|nr:MULTISPECIES: lipoprotein [Halomonas]MYL26168.1 lipopeptide [Halomonas utahensis]MYL73270.1 lipopeptide [Halomonas sp. 22501_18_FS]
MRGSILALLALMLVLAGCGQKGPLYREGDPEGPESARAPASYTIPSHLC